jgi:Fe-S oxidoreductase
VSDSPRAEQRPFRSLPLLESSRHELETCSYCPKLCRTSCPVSNALPSEALIPWGKMLTATMVAQGDLPGSAEVTADFWACTQCGACESFCHHKNPVGNTLALAKAALFGSGQAHPAATQHCAEQPAREAALHATAAGYAAPGSDAPYTLLLGCGATPEDVRPAVDLLTRWFGARPNVLSSCCGADLAAAGDQQGARAKSERLAAETSKPIVCLDPECARQLRAQPGATPLTLAELAVQYIGPASERGGPESADVLLEACAIRTHAPSHAAMATLVKAFGARLTPSCAGGGNLLPQVYPEATQAMSAAVLENEQGMLVTSCPRATLALRHAGAAGGRVKPLARWLLAQVLAQTQGTAP